MHKVLKFKVTGNQHSMLTEIRMGVVGAGYMAKMHSLAIRNLGGLSWPGMPRLEMRRVADTAPGVAEGVAKQWGWASASSDWRDVTRAPDIDAVIILTPNDSHCELTEDAFRHGKHVLCEKPLANTLESASAMLAASRTSNRRGMVNFVYRNWPAIQLARELIEAGRLGDLTYFTGSFFQDYAADMTLQYAWRHNRAVAGSGALGDIGSHIIDIACHLMGPVERLSARTARLFPTRPDATGRQVEVDVDDLAVLLAGFKSGATGTVSAGWVMAGHKTNLAFTVVGTKGSVKFDWEHSNELHVYEASSDKRVDGFRRVVIGGMHPQADMFWYAPGQGLGYAEAFAITLRRFVESIVSGIDSTPSFEEAYHVSEVTDAAWRAAETGRWVDLPSGEARFAAAV